MYTDMPLLKCVQTNKMYDVRKITHIVHIQLRLCYGVRFIIEILDITCCTATTQTLNIVKFCKIMERFNCTFNNYIIRYLHTLLM